MHVPCTNRNTCASSDDCDLTNSSTGVAIADTTAENCCANDDTGNVVIKLRVHINLLIDQAVACASGLKCDSAYIPKMSLYVRGRVTVAANRSASGDGVITLADAEACKTLMPDVSSCKLTSAQSGSFTISGQIQDDKLQMTLHLKDVPRLAVTLTTKHPVQGTIAIPLDSTYYQEIKKLLESAQIFDAPLTVAPAITTSGNAQMFEGKYVFATFDKSSARTTHGYGGLFFISTDTPLPKPYEPRE